MELALQWRTSYHSEEQCHFAANMLASAYFRLPSLNRQMTEAFEHATSVIQYPLACLDKTIAAPQVQLKLQIRRKSQLEALKSPSKMKKRRWNVLKNEPICCLQTQFEEYVTIRKQLVSTIHSPVTSGNTTVYPIFSLPEKTLEYVFQQVGQDRLLYYISILAIILY